MSPEEVLAFWFADAPAEYRDIWFRASPEFDAACAARFSDALRKARSGALNDWANEPRSTLALVILLDQLSRNIHRGSPEAYRADKHALAIARTALTRGFDAQLGPVERVFLYLPFMHAEGMAEQEESVRLFEGLRGTFDGADAAIDAARRHRDLIQRFGRFPHRNAVLGRASTPEEQAFIAEPGRRSKRRP